MAFPSDDLHYNYAYSVESSSPYSPNFPSTPSVYDDGFDSQPHIYQHGQLCDPDYDSSSCSSAVLHAPTPLPGLLRSDYPFFRPQLSPPPVDYIPEPPAHDAPHNTYGDPAQITFPTPSELLVELSGRNSTTDQLRVEKKSETRKARRRAIAKSVGFVPTDPDTISSHDKKRHYLECLEHYVMYLHEQLRLVGAEPVNLERVSNYRGLNSRSIRTLLVHMENTNRKLNLRTLDEEHRFITLRDAVCRQDAVANHDHQSMPFDVNCITEVPADWQW